MSDRAPAVTSALASGGGEPWMTEHSVIAVGRPLLARAATTLASGDIGRVEGRLRVQGTDDGLVACTGRHELSLASQERGATIESGARVIRRGGAAASGRMRLAR